MFVLKFDTVLMDVSNLQFEEKGWGVLTLDSC